MYSRRRDLLALASALLAGSALSGCLGTGGNGGGGGGTSPEPPLLASNRPREDPSVPQTELETLTQGNTDFALALHQQLVEASPGDNLFVSPFSISVALAMTYGGARSTTEAQMAEATRFLLDQKRLHPAFNRLDRTIEERDEAQDEDDGQPFELAIVNSIWGQDGYPFRESYLDTLAVNYGAGLRALDFVADPDSARVRINDWVEDQTNDRIEDLLPPGIITELTRLVLTNAIYFKANWLHTFPEEATEDGEFTALDGSASTVPMMHQSEQFPYAEVDEHQLVELPYVGGDVGMVVLLPAEGTFESFERDLDSDRLGSLLDALEPREGSIAFPRFTYESSFQLKAALSALGMPVAFDPMEADFGGMADIDQTGENLYIQDVVHKSFVAVDEEGTEAAAATAVVVGTTSAPMNPFEMVVDRPFLYLIRDRETGAILFLGRVVDAGAAQ